MPDTMIIKGKNFKGEKPLICLPVTKTKKEEIISEVARLVSLGADVVEWRLDAYEEVDNLNAIRQVLAELKPLVENTPLIYTFRSKGQGGLKELSQEQIFDIHQIGAESKVADFIDVEYFASSKAHREITSLQKMGVYVIASHHDFKETPDKNIISMLLSDMREGGADIVKLALMPQCPGDVLSLMEETAIFHERYKETPVITMSMGKLGMVSRISGALTGSCLTFGNAGEASAPGQVDFSDLKKILDLLDEPLP